MSDIHFIIQPQSGINFDITPNVMRTSLHGGISGIIASNRTYTSGNVIFSGQNNITIGTSSDGVSQWVRMSVANAAGQTYQPVAMSGSNTSLTASTISFGNSNNISHYITNGSLVASFSQSTHAHDYIPIGSSTRSAGVNTSTVSTGGSDLKFSFNSSGGTFSVPKWIITAAQVSHSHGDVSTIATAGSVLTVSSESNGLTLAIPAWITTAAGGASWELEGANTSGTTGTAFSTLYLEGGNNITLSGNSNTIKFSVANAAGQTYQPVAFSGSNTSLTASTISFGNSNNISHYITNGSLVASFSESTHAHSFVNQINGSSGSISFNTASSLSSSADASGITFGLASNISTAWSGQTTANQSRVLDFNGSSGQISFVTGSGMSTTTNASTLTFGLRSDISTAWSGQTTANQSRVIQFNGSSGSISFNTGSSLSSSANASGITIGLASDISSAWSGINSSRVQQINGSSGSISFNTGSSLSSSANASGITFGLASNITTALQSAGAYLTTAAGVSHTHGSLSLSLSNISGTYSSASNGLTISLTGNTGGTGGGGSWELEGTKTSGTTGSAFSTLFLEAYNNITLSGNSNTIRFSVGNYVDATETGSVYFQNSNGLSFGSSTSSVSTSITANYAAIKNLVLSGTTTGTMATISSGTMTLAGGNNITLSQNGNAVTIIGASGGTGGGAGSWELEGTKTSGTTGSAFSTLFLEAYNNITLSGNSNTIRFSVGNYIDASESGSVYFQNSNGISWGSSVSSISTSITGDYAAIKNIVASGNTSGTMVTVSSGTMTLAGGNNITLSQSGNAISIIGAAAGTGGAGTGFTGTNATGTLNSNGLAISVNTGGAGGAAIQGSGTYSQNTGTVQFQTGNGITFGLSNNGIMTASYTVPSGSVYFTNGQNVTWSTTADGVSTSIMLTAGGGTGAADGGNVLAVSGATANSTGTVVFLNSNSITFGMSDSTQITASFSQSTHAHSFVNQINGSSGSISLNTGSSLSSSANASGITFGLASNITTALQPAGAYLTTAAQVSHSHGNVSLSLASLSGTYSSASNGFTLSLTAINSSNFINTSQSGNFYFQNANGLTWSSSVDGLSTSLSLSLNSLDGTYSVGSAKLSVETNGEFGIQLGNIIWNTTTDQFYKGMMINAAYNDLYVAAQEFGGNTVTRRENFLNVGASNIYFADGRTYFNSSNFNSSSTSQMVIHFDYDSGLKYASNNSEISSNWSTNTGWIPNRKYVDDKATGAAESNYVYLYGNTSNASTTSGSTMSLSGGDNITLAISGGSIQIKGAAGAGGAISGSNTSQSLGTITFGSSNNMHFYFTNSSLVGSFSESTHAHSFVNQINGSSGSISLNTGSSLSSSANASGITFGLASNISTAWSGQTTANQSRVLDFNGSSGQISFVTGSGMSTTTNASTLTFGLRSDISTAWSGQTTANQSRVIAFNGSSGQISFVTGSGMSTTTNASTLTFGLRSDISTAWSGQTTANASRVIQLNASSGSLTLSASSNITISNDASTIKFSVADAIGLGSSTRFAGINTSSSSTGGSDLKFSLNSSGATFSVPAWLTTAYSATSQFSASFLNTGEAHIRQLQASNTTYTAGTVELSGSRNISISYNASTISIYGPANILNSLSIGGNTGTTNSSNITGGGFVIAGGSNITLSQSNNTISIHGGAGGGGVAVADSQTTYTSGTVIISGQANITINTSVNGGSQYIRISGGAGAGESNYIYLYGNTSNLSSTSGQTISLSGGTNITLAQSGGSIKIDGPSGNVYMQNASGISWSTSADGGSTSISGIFNATGSTITTTSGTDAKMTLNTAGLNLALPIFITNAYSASSQLTATFAQVSHTHGNVSIGQTNISVSGTTASNGLSLDFSVAAPAGGAAIKGSGTYSQNTGTVEFANSNGMTFGLSNNGTMTAQNDAARYYYLMGINTAGTTSGTFSQNALRLSGYNMITLNGVNDSVIEISLNSGSLLGTLASSQFAKGWSLAGANTSGTTTQNISQTLYLSGGNNITLSGNASTIIISAGGVALSAGTQSVNSGSMVFSNSNGLTFGMSGSSRITGSHDGVRGWMLLGANTAGTSSQNGVTQGILYFSGGDNITLSGNESTLIFSVGAGGGGIALSAGTQSVSTGTVVYSNSNGLTFGMSGSSRVTASYNSTQFARGWSLGTSTGGSTAGTTTQNVSESLYLVAGSNINLSGSGSSIVIHATPKGSVYFADIVGFSWTSTTAANATTFALKTI